MKIPTSLLFSCADSAYNHLSKILQDTINDIAPIKDICIKGNTKPQFDSNMIGLIRKRDLKKKRKKGFYIRNCMLITNTLRNNEIQFKGRFNERKQAMLRNNCRKILIIRKNFGKQLRTWVCHARLPISQRFVSEKIICYSSMKIKIPIPSKICTKTQLRIQ